MDKQTRSAIVAIIVIIPLVSIVVWDSEQTLVSSGPISNQKISVLTSFYPLFEFTKQVGSDKVDVSLLVPQGVEPHNWEPTITDLQRMQQADVIVINGIGFESWVGKINSINSNVLIVDTSSGISIIDRTDIIHHDGRENNSDPHIWLNPVTAKIQVQNIADSLIVIDPKNQKFYLENRDSYLSKLDSLDAKIRNELASCSKDFITFHQAFSYFADEFGLVQHTILNSNDPHAEPTSKTLQQVINLAKELNIDIIFTEAMIDTRTSNVVANEIGGKVLVLSTLEIGDDNTNYIQKMEENLSNLKEALC